MKKILLTTLLLFLIITCDNNSTSPGSDSTTYTFSHMLLYENADCTGETQEISGLCMPSSQAEGFDALICLFMNPGLFDDIVSDSTETELSPSEIEQVCNLVEMCEYLSLSTMMNGFELTLHSDGQAFINNPAMCSDGGMLGTYSSQDECESDGYAWQDATSATATWSESNNVIMMDISVESSLESISFIRSGDNLIQNDSDDDDEDGINDSCSGMVFTP